MIPNSIIMIRNRALKKVFIGLVFALFSTVAFAQPEMDAGKKLFKNNCAACHNKNMKSDMTGPALADVQSRWESEELLYNWIRNSGSVIASGDIYANKLYLDWNKSQMTPFPNLTDEEVSNILTYIQGVSEGVYPPPVISDQGNSVQGSTQSTGSNISLYLVIFGILGLLSIILARIISNLNYLADIKETGVGRKKTLLDILKSKTIVGFLAFGLILIGGYATVNSAVNLNRQQGYQPDQPIAFSHEKHAGLQAIDCQYCHDGARRSKHSIIPATNTCMNCHKAIKIGPTHGANEIAKIYASAGYNPITDRYDGVDEATNEKNIKKWLGQNYNEEIGVDKKSELDDKGHDFVNKKWDDIKKSLTTDNKNNVIGPIPWVRIHNLPDHAYFNHSQHVVVGEVKCQTCHGKIEEMTTVSQYAPLSMGWCINCHRNTSIGYQENAKTYYQGHYKKITDQLISGERSSFTVEDIGGLECQKCHY